MAQRLRALRALAENIGLVGFQYPHGGLKTSVTVVPGNPILASVSSVGSVDTCSLQIRMHTKHSYT